MISTPVQAAVARARAWAIDAALPFWSTAGFDAAAGAFHERVDFEGRPILSVPRRTMAQARQIYAFAHAHELGWSAPGGDLALRATRTLIARHWRADGADGFVFSLSPEGAVADPRRDTYAHAFALYGLAWAHRVEPDPLFREIADATYVVLDTLLAAPTHGGYIDGAPRPDQLRRQNPHMHLFEASLAWYEATADARYLARAGEIFGHFKTRFFHAPTGYLTEYFDDSWQPAPGDLGRICEPGHHCEWVWLLAKYARLSGSRVEPYTGPLYRSAFLHGRAENGLLVDEFFNDGRIAKTSQRCWPHTEAVKAAAAMAETRHTEAGQTEAGHADNAAACLDILMDRFLGRPFKGGWIDHFDRDGGPLVDFAPSSTLYHALLAIAEADRVFGHGDG
jgi:mannose/cellobiose epimerase-like protein (N-acyl-D-glucosamine 2-epimerase family)